MNLSSSFRELPFKEEISPLWLKLIYTVLSAFTRKTLPPADFLQTIQQGEDICQKRHVIRVLRARNSSLGYRLLLALFQVVVVSILLYGCTTWTLTKRIEKKAWWQFHKDATSYMKKNPGSNIPKNSSCTVTYHPSQKQSKFRRTRHAEYCWRSKDELISDVLLWTPSQGRASVGRLARTYLQQRCTDTECSLEDMLEAMDDRDEGERDS